jgi:hypothetical protein
MARPATDMTLGRRIDNDCHVFRYSHFFLCLMVPNTNEHPSHVALYDPSVLEFNGYGIPDLHCDIPWLEMGVMAFMVFLVQEFIRTAPSIPNPSIPFATSLDYCEGLG